MIMTKLSKKPNPIYGSEWNVPTRKIPNIRVALFNSVFKSDSINFLKKAIMFECIEEFYREPNPSLIDKFQVHL